MSALITRMRVILDILRGLVLAIAVFQAAVPAAAGASGARVAVSCLGAVFPGEEDGDDRGLHAACWACCTAPAALRPAEIPQRRAPPHALARNIDAGAQAPPRIAPPRPSARGPPSSS